MMQEKQEGEGWPEPEELGRAMDESLEEALEEEEAAGARDEEAEAEWRELREEIRRKWIRETGHEPTYYWQWRDPQFWGPPPRERFPRPVGKLRWRCSFCRFVAGADEERQLERAARDHLYCSHGLSRSELRRYLPPVGAWEVGARA
jgi:hypothetical protein